MVWMNALLHAGVNMTVTWGWVAVETGAEWRRGLGCSVHVLFVGDGEAAEGAWTSIT